MHHGSLLPTASTGRPTPWPQLFPLPCQCSVMHYCLSSLCSPSYQELTRQKTQGTLTHQHDRDALNRVHCWTDLLKPAPALICGSLSSHSPGSSLCSTGWISSDSHRADTVTRHTLSKTQVRGPHSQLDPRPPDFPY